MPDLTTTRVRASVVIPTYNRSEMLRNTLRSLADQRFPPDELEVVVSDDGSSDATADVVKAFSSQLRLRCHFQEDLGFRAAAARNAGAGLASAPVLIFLDTGTLAGPNFVRAHLAEHVRRVPGSAVMGYTYGYRPLAPVPGLAEAISMWPPEEVVARYQDDPRLRDWRHEELARVDFDVNRRALPWVIFWATNISVSTADFWAVGGFDEDFRTWGAEDLELAYRLRCHGASFVFSRQAWGLETPHERDIAAIDVSNKGNMLTFLGKHPHPSVEVAWAVFMRHQVWPVEYAYRNLLEWTRDVRDLDVAYEIEDALRDHPEVTGRVAVIGCGRRVPASLPEGSVLVDFDREALAIAAAGSKHDTHHAIGLRTPVPDNGVGLVVLTSRLRGLMDEWHPELLAEARRIGRVVHGPLVASPKA